LLRSDPGPRDHEDCESVLAQFGKRVSDARQAYHRFVAGGSYEDPNENFVHLVNSVPIPSPLAMACESAMKIGKREPVRIFMKGTTARLSFRVALFLVG
jgi:hypothetical protein